MYYVRHNICKIEFLAVKFKQIRARKQTNNFLNQMGLTCYNCSKTLIKKSPKNLNHKKTNKTVENL